MKILKFLASFIVIFFLSWYLISLFVVDKCCEIMFIMDFNYIWSIALFSMLIVSIRWLLKNKNRVSIPSILVMAYKLRDYPAKVLKIITTKYVTTTTKLLPTQRKLFLVVVISGALFLLTNTIALIKFNLIFNDSRQLAAVYGEQNFMLPKPPFNASRIERGEYIIFTRAFERGELGLYSGWSWYTDEVFLTGLIFVVSLSYFLMSVIISRVISEKASIPK